MKLTKKIYLLIGIAILLILSNGIFFIRMISIEKNISVVNNSQQVIQISTELLSIIKDGETGQRGYILTNNPDYLKPFSEAKQQFKSRFHDFKALTDTIHYSKADIDRLELLLNRKMDELTRTVELTRKNRSQEALLLIRSNRGQILMTEIGQEINKLVAEEKRRLTAYETTVKRSTQKTRAYAIISNTLLLVIAIASIINIRNNRRSMRHLFAQVEEKNDLLEQQRNELQRLSHGLIQQNRDLERFAYVASHDLRAPAANIEALLRLYLEAKNQKERESLIETMQDVSENLSAKLNDLVDDLKSKKEINRLNETLSLKEIYDKVIQNLSVEIRKTNAIIKCDFSSAENVTSPKSYIESILQNLISNALKYRDPDRRPEVSIRSFKNQGRTCLIIADNGLGIDLKKHGSDLFGLHKTFHNHRDSKGVGLYITRAQVLALGGRIDVDSEPGKGTQFTVCL